MSEAGKREPTGWPENQELVSWVYFGDRECWKESSNLSPSEGADCVQVCESGVHKLGA